jgi:type IV secretory pathway TrbD component
MDQSYNVIAGVVALAIAVAIIVWIARAVRRRFRVFSRTMTFLS